MNIEILVEKVADLLRQRGMRLAVAESCTGGWIAMALTGLTGSSDWFDRGFVTYSNQAKQELLGVKAQTLQTQGAVSEATVAEMTSGAMEGEGIDVALAVSGIAGPGGGSLDKPVGTVCFAWRLRDGKLLTAREWFAGDREAVRRQSVAHALQRLIEILEDG